MNASERSTGLLREWDAFASHRTGTADDAATAEWMCEHARAAGAEPSLVSFPFRCRLPRAAWLELGGTRLHGVPAYDGGSTGPDGVAARLAALADGHGIGLCSAAPQLNTAGSQHLLAARRAGQHPGIVCFTDATQVRAGLAPFNADDWAAPHGPPVLQLGSEHAPTLLAAANEGALTRLVIDDDWQDGTASNVEVHIAGRDPLAAPLVIMTPRSGWWTCTSERGGGLVLWFEALRALRARAPRRNVIFTANTGHELGHVGLHHFLQAHPGLAARALWLHLGANFAATGGRTRLQASDAGLRDLARGHVESRAARIDDETPLGTRPFGEARDIHDAGGRYVSLLGSNPLFHHPEDRWPDAVDLPRTLALARAFVDLVESLAN